MNPLYSYILDIILVAAFIVDRIFRLRSLKEYKEAKEAQIEHLRQLLESERKNNDIEITEMHKKRYENLKLVLDEKEKELENSASAFSGMQAELTNAVQEADLKARLNLQLVMELNRVEKDLDRLKLERKKLDESDKFIIRPSRLDEDQDKGTAVTAP